MPPARSLGPVFDGKHPLSPALHQWFDVLANEVSEALLSQQDATKRDA